MLFLLYQNQLQNFKTLKLCGDHETLYISQKKYRKVLKQLKLKSTLPSPCHLPATMHDIAACIHGFGSLLFRLADSMQR